MIPAPLPFPCIIWWSVAAACGSSQAAGHLLMSREFCNMFYLLVHYADTPTIER
jgi:hypothetical protein